MKTTEVEAKLNEGNIQEAESSLREGLSLNFEEARALLGRLEYQRGNVEGALCVFDGIDLQAAIHQPLWYSNLPLNLLRKSLHKYERPDDLMALLLAAEICFEDSHLAAEGVGCAQRIISNGQGKDAHLNGVGLHVLSLCLGKQAKASS